jgi:hypothetical protein
LVGSWVGGEKAVIGLFGSWVGERKAEWVGWLVGSCETASGGRSYPRLFPTNSRSNQPTHCVPKSPLGKSSVMRCATLARSLRDAGPEEPRGHRVRLPDRHRRLSTHRHVSGRRAIRPDAADAARGCVHRLQHLGGMRTAGKPGAPALALYRHRRGEGARVPATRQRWTRSRQQLGACPVGR